MKGFEDGSRNNDITIRRSWFVGFFLVVVGLIGVMLYFLSYAIGRGIANGFDDKEFAHKLGSGIAIGLKDEDKNDSPEKDS